MALPSTEQLMAGVMQESNHVLKEFTEKMDVILNRLITLVTKMI